MVWQQHTARGHVAHKAGLLLRVCDAPHEVQLVPAHVGHVEQEAGDGPEQVLQQDIAITFALV